MAEAGSKIPKECIPFIDKPYQVGTIKLTWIDPDNYKILSGKMFDTVEEALNNIPKSKGNNWLLFKLLKTDGKEYNWELMPYGKYKGYENGMKLRDNKLLYYGSISLMLLGAFYLIKIAHKKLKLK